MTTVIASGETTRAGAFTSCVESSELCDLEVPLASAVYRSPTSPARKRAGSLSLVFHEMGGRGHADGTAHFLVRHRKMAVVKTCS